MTRRVGLIGAPIGQSLSPLLHSTLYKLAGVDATYELWEFPPEKFPTDFKTQFLEHWHGLNVTTPYKRQVLDFCDNTSSAPAVLRAANFLAKGPHGTVYGENKDVDGAFFAMQGLLAANPNTAPAWFRQLHLLGFGPAGRALVMAYARFWRAERIRLRTHFGTDPGPGQVRVYVRTRHEAYGEPMAQLTELGSDTFGIEFANWDEIPTDELNGLLINATTCVDSSPLASLPGGAYGIWDVNYARPVPALVAQAREAGRWALDGIPMLVWQGFFSAARWFPDRINAQRDLGMTKQVLDVLRKELGPV